VAQAEDMPRLIAAAVLAAAMLTSVSAASAASRSVSHTRHSHHAVRAAAVAPVASRNPVTTAAAIAERFWGAVPCDGQIKIVADSPLASGLQAGTDAWVTFNSSLGADNLDAPASSYAACTITLAHWQWANWTAMEGDWGMFCLTVTHEMGHLLGHKHTLRAGSVMNPVFTDDSDVPAICNANWLPGWRTGGTV
jgi:matrixin